MFESVQLGQLTAKWSPDNQLVLTTPHWQHICTADEVVALLEMLYEHKDAVFVAAHRHDHDQPQTTVYEETNPRYHVINDTSVSSPSDNDGEQTDTSHEGA